MINYELIINVLLHVVIMIFSCLSLAIAFSKARVHLTWLIPTVMGWGLWLLGSLLNLAFISSLSQNGFHGSPWRWLMVPQQIVYILGAGCLVWAAVALYWNLQSSAARPVMTWEERQPSRGSGDSMPKNEGIWPPPPSSPAV